MIMSLIVMPSNAEAERCFSIQNRIKTRLWPGRTISHMDQLMRVWYHKFPVADFHLRKLSELSTMHHISGKIADNVMNACICM